MTRPSLDVPQQALLDEWLPGHRVVDDIGWGLVDRTVLLVEHDGQRFVVKASGPGDRHTEREVAAHHRWTAPLVERGRAPRLRWADAAVRIMVADWLPGELVAGTPAQDDPEVFRQAGGLLRVLHDGSPSRTDGTVVSRQAARTLAWLDGQHRIDPGIVRAVRDEVAGWQDIAVELVACHADYQPRNWIVEAGRVSVIDFGGMEMAPRASDFVRISRDDARRTPGLAEAFVDGYGVDPRTDPLWRVLSVAQAVSTAAWAYQVGDQAFEAQGHGWLDEAMDGWPLGHHPMQ